MIGESEPGQVTPPVEVPLLLGHRSLMVCSEMICSSPNFAPVSHIKAAAGVFVFQRLN